MYKSQLKDETFTKLYTKSQVGVTVLVNDVKNLEYTYNILNNNIKLIKEHGEKKILIDITRFPLGWMDITFSFYIQEIISILTKTEKISVGVLYQAHKILKEVFDKHSQRHEETPYGYLHHFGLLRVWTKTFSEDYYLHLLLHKFEDGYVWY